MPVKKETNKGIIKKFSAQFWLVVIFEFFERGSYYGMMSFISIYFSDTLFIPKESVGVIKGVIQPLLYFLPIISGAIADRFGYRRILMVSFALLGGGYFLTSQVTSYTAVFIALVIMGIGAGTFKPIISGTIARITDETNSTQAFGVYYWSINLGAFLFPLFLVPFLKSLDPSYVIIASGICTAAMLIPTAIFFKEPTRQKESDVKAEKRKETGMIQTLANAFEIIYSPLVLLYKVMQKSTPWRIVISIVLVIILGCSVFSYLHTQPAAEKFPSLGLERDNVTLIYKVERNMLVLDNFKLKFRKDHPQILDLIIYKPTALDKFATDLTLQLKSYLWAAQLFLTRSSDYSNITGELIADMIKKSDKKIELVFVKNSEEQKVFKIQKISENQYQIDLKNSDDYPAYKSKLLQELHRYPILRGITQQNCDNLHNELESRSFFSVFLVSLILIALLIISASSQRINTNLETNRSFNVPLLIVPAAILVIFFLPGLNILGRIIAAIIYFSIMSLFLIDKSDTKKFVDHSKFLLMIILYSGFWILYFQMFDSVLWYVQAYVNAATLNSAVNGFLGFFGIKINWFFDVEHVTVINAGTIILLQLWISSLVKKRKALPTMINGIAVATVGMGILAISTGIWVFLLGIILFSIGEMIAHPKFISYIGLVAPREKKAMYMGYLFLYGVFGSSVGGIMGAKLYVHFVDNLNQPRILWLIFSGIGLLTIIALLLYNKFLTPREQETSPKLKN